MTNCSTLRIDEHTSILDRMRRHIEDKEYDLAINLGDKYSDMLKYPVVDNASESFYGDLVALRITANTLSGHRDFMIQHISREERFNHKQSIRMDTGHKIRVVSKNISMFQTDAIINSIHKTKLFDYSPESLSRQFLSVLGQEEINRQISDQRGSKLPFLLLQHPGTLKAQVSYHIPAYYDDNQLDIDALTTGYQAVLYHIAKQNFKDIAVAPIGLSANNKQDERDLTIQRTAKTLIDFLYEHPTMTFPKVYFPCANQETFYTTIKMLKLATPVGYYKENAAITFKENEQLLKDAIATNDETYNVVLKRLGSHLNDDVIILLLGETGSGKSFLAREFHKASNRKHSGEFYHLNCGSLTPSLQMSEIFGAQKGAFTGAIQNIDSIFDKAKGGTVFLDEIGYANLEVQAALLTTLDTGRYRKVGSRTEDLVNARLMFGTNADLVRMIRERRFLPELYERISNSLKLTVPPLRSRPKDIPLCIDPWLKAFNSERSPKGLREHAGVTNDAIRLLQKYSWPGNVRQLFFYLQTLFYETLANDRDTIDEQVIQSNPPRNVRLQAGDALGVFEDATYSLLDQWIHEEKTAIRDGKNRGSFIEEVVEPVIANLYFSNYDPEVVKSGVPKRDVRALIGLNGDGAKQSLFIAKDKYPTTRNRFDDKLKS